MLMYRKDLLEQKGLKMPEQPKYEDIKKIADAIGDSKIVGVGEPTHGTSEAFRLKANLFEYLVEKKGFTCFALEDGFAFRLLPGDG